MKLGKVSGNVLKRSVWKQIHTRRDEIKDSAGADCAIFALTDTHIPDMVSCMQESAVSVRDKICTEQKNVSFASAGTFGEPVRTMAHLIQKCVNNMVISGAEPLAVMITLLLPQETEETELKALMAEADEVCERLSIQIAGGQTRVTKSVNLPFAVVTGYGKLSKKTYGVFKTARPGQDIVLSKWIGLEGTAMLARRGREKLLARYPAYLVEEAIDFDRYLSIVPEAAAAVKSGVCAMHDASEGGIFAALWELAEGAGVGLTIDLKKLPIRQETVEVCEVLNANPYELLSGGCLIMTTEDGASLAAALQAEGLPAVVVGKMTDSNDRLILNEDEVRYMDRPKQDAIYGY
ncbi:MAG: hydrogenase maturation factor [Lachnospiraceae bacterium]|nr:hydrogenase maturation factor [Lachnospiraceae bacterium]